jgi:hypothetical protein
MACLCGTLFIWVLIVLRLKGELVIIVQTFAHGIFKKSTWYASMLHFINLVVNNGSIESKLVIDV